MQIKCSVSRKLEYRPRKHSECHDNPEVGTQGSKFRDEFLSLEVCRLKEWQTGGYGITFYGTLLQFQSPTSRFVGMVTTATI